MTTILLFRDLYTQAFKKMQFIQLVVLKSLTWFALGMIALGFLAFVFRITSGFFTI